MQQRHILIVEDEPDLVSVLERNLLRENFRVFKALSGEEGWRILEKERVDLVLLDLMLPGISGIEFCRRLRGDARNRNTLVIMLTAKGEEIDRVVGFEVGSDDYMVKPYSVRELLLRIHALFRRAENPAQSGASEVRVGLLRLDTEAHQAWVGDEPVTLTAMEFKLLALLVARRGRVQSRDQLLETVWGYSAEVQSRTVDAHVKRLREKLGPVGGYIETLRGVGYRFQGESTPGE